MVGAIEDPVANMINKKGLNIKAQTDMITLSSEVELAIKKDFEGVTGKLEIDLNQGGIRGVLLKLKLK